MCYRLLNSYFIFDRDTLNASAVLPYFILHVLRTTAQQCNTIHYNKTHVALVQHQCAMVVAEVRQIRSVELRSTMFQGLCYR